MSTETFLFACCPARISAAAAKSRRPGLAEEPTTITFAPIDAGDPSEEQSVTLPDLPDGAGLLWVKRGPNAGSKYVLDKEVVLAGRHPDSDIFLDDITVSRRHAEIHATGDTFTLVDLGSTNGTKVNGVRVAQRELQDGDELTFGNIRLIFQAS